jgi:hypothetical protein
VQEVLGFYIFYIRREVGNMGEETALQLASHIAEGGGPLFFGFNNNNNII